MNMGREVVRKCPYLEKDYPVMSENGVYKENQEEIKRMLKEINKISSF